MPGSYLELRLNAHSLVLVAGNDAEAAGALPVQAHVFGEGLAERQLVPVLQEQPHRRCICIAVPAGKALVGHVKEWEEPLL